MSTPSATTPSVTTPSVVALIPARQGSKRVPGKNARTLGEHPVIAYTIAPALESGVFESVIVSTDSEEIAAIARHYGAEVPFLRPSRFAGDRSPDRAADAGRVVRQSIEFLDENSHQVPVCNGMTRKIQHQ